MDVLSDKFKSSYKSLKDTKVLAGAGLFIALSLILNLYGTIRLAPTLVISFTFIAAALCSMKYGPVVGGLCGLIADNLKFFLMPNGPYCPLFTINEILAGIIYGIFFYKSKITLTKTFICYGIVVVFLNIILNPLWMTILYGKGFWFYVSQRLATNLILYPIKSVILYFILKYFKAVVH